MNSQFYGVITAREEFLYPDSVLSPLPDSLFLFPLIKWNAAIFSFFFRQKEILFPLNWIFSSEESETCNSPFLPEFFQMQAIPVEYNTGDGVSQGGSMVLENPPSEKPGYQAVWHPFLYMTALFPMKIIFFL